jgi:rhamnosyltransferase
MAATDLSVCAVVVTYRARPEPVRELVRSVAVQVAHVVVVANESLTDRNAGAPAEPGESSLDRLATVLRQPVNIGLAAAQNLGIEWARAQGCSHVLLLDQDSTPAPDMVARLLDGLRELSARPGAVGAGPVGAVGPRFRDEREDRDAPFVRVGFPMSKKIWCTDGCRSVDCDFLIASGALIPLAVLASVGPMHDGLFIDNVDLEWSFRARSRGYSLHGICAATMAHQLGESRQRALFGRLEITTHPPVRLYFIMRNRLALYRLPHTPRVWIAQDVPRVLAKFLIFALLVGPRGTNVRYMLRGVLDGIRGRLGPSPSWMTR